jgi:undecaprenyl-diphosphatase
MHATITGLLESYGYFFLFIFVGLESLGIPLPGETALVTAAAYAALGHLDIRGVIIAAAAGAILGDNCGYWIGREGGIALVRRWGRVLHLNESHLTRAHEFFQRHGGKTVFIGRFIALLRTWAAVLAGAGCMPYRPFLFYNATGGIVWAVIYGTLGYLFGQNLPRLEHSIGQASLALVLLVTLVILLVLVMRAYRAHSAAIAARTAAAWRRTMESERVSALRRDHPRAWSFVAARFARGEYLGLHLTIGLLIALAALWVFGAITEDVITHDTLTRFDEVLLHWMRSHSTHTGDRIMSGISLIGSPGAMAVVALVMVIVLAVRRKWLALSGWIATFVGGGIIDAVLKQVIHRPRPLGAEMFLHQFSYSFPSGHAMGSTFGYGMLAYLLVTFWSERRGVRIAIIAGAFILIIAIGVSRLYLGVHYFSDVIGGYAAGTLWLASCISGVDVARRQPRTMAVPAA